MAKIRWEPRMSFKTWFSFIRDYVIGLFRQKQHDSASTRTSAKIASYRYFQTIDFSKYMKYHTSLNSELFLKHAITEMNMELKPYSLIVDLGAGFCDLELALASVLPHDAKILAIDFQPHMLSAGKKRLDASRSSIFKSWHVVADIEQCPISSESTDLAVCINTTSYLDTLYNVSEEVRRILKKHAKFILVQPHKNPFWEEEFDGVKLNFFNSEQTISIFEQRDMKLLEKTEINFSFLPFTKKFKSTYAHAFKFAKMI